MAVVPSTRLKNDFQTCYGKSWATEDREHWSTMCKQLWRALTVVAAIGEEGEPGEPKPAMEKYVLFVHYQVVYHLYVVSPQKNLSKIII